MGEASAVTWKSSWDTLVWSLAKDPVLTGGRPRTDARVPLWHQTLANRFSLALTLLSEDRSGILPNAGADAGPLRTCPTSC